MEWEIDMEQEECKAIESWTHYVTLIKLWLHLWYWPWIFKAIFQNNCISGMVGSIDMMMASTRLYTTNLRILIRICIILSQ